MNNGVISNPFAFDDDGDYGYIIIIIIIIIINETCAVKPIC
jgi:hypothetical protein